MTHACTHTMAFTNFISEKVPRSSRVKYHCRAYPDIALRPWHIKTKRTKDATWKINSSKKVK